MTNTFAQLLEASDVAKSLGCDDELGYKLYAHNVNLTPVKTNTGITAYVNYNGTDIVGDYNVQKLRFNLIDIVYWYDHPLYGLVEMAVEDGEMSEDDEPTEAMQSQAEELIKEWIEEAFEETTGEQIEALTESESFSCYGGWVVTARLKNPHSLAVSTTGKIKARSITSSNN